MQPEEFARRFIVSRESLEQLKTYDALLKKWQKAINLISPATINESWQRHFADSAQVAAYIPQDMVVADLGSGAGFPGLVLAMMRPDLKINLVESDTRKCEFLKTVSRETRTGAVVHNARIETVLDSLNPGVITARAYASLIDILSISESVAVKNPKLVFVLLKGKGAAEEIAEARKTYNFSIESIDSVTEQGASILIIRDLQRL